MSYCVNCGVELDQNLEQCPLCGCPVINPMDLLGNTQKEPHQLYPKKVEIVDNRAERRFSALILSILFVMPMLICLAIDLFYFQTISWSIIVAGSCVLMWIFTVPPILAQKVGPPWFLLLDGVALAGFLKMLEYDLGGNWFAPVALPITLYLTAVTVLLVFFKRRKALTGLYLFTAIFLSGGLLAVLIDQCIRLYTSLGFRITWSWFVLIPCTAVALLLLFIEKRPKFKASLIRRFHL